MLYNHNEKKDRYQITGGEYLSNREKNVVQGRYKIGFKCMGHLLTVMLSCTHITQVFTLEFYSILYA